MVHPRGAPHLENPERLTASSRLVYGEDNFNQLFERLVPVPAERIWSPADGESLSLGDRTLTFFHTEGHARHHLCIHDDRSDGLFTGDSFGLRYPEFDHPDTPLLYPATTPTQFDPDAAHATVDRLAAMGPRTLYLTHYAPLAFAPRLADGLHALLDAFVALARDRGAPGPDRHAILSRGVEEILLARWTACGGRADITTRGLLAADVDTNAQGLAHWVDRERRRRPN